MLSAMLSAHHASVSLSFRFYHHDIKMDVKNGRCSAVMLSAHHASVSLSFRFYHHDIKMDVENGRCSAVMLSAVMHRFL